MRRLLQQSPGTAPLWRQANRRTDDLEDEVTLIPTDSHHEETAIREQAVSLVTSAFGKEKGQLLTESEALDLNSVYLCA